MAVAGILTAAEIGDAQEIGVPLSDPAERLLDDSGLRVVFRTELIFLSRYSEEQHCLNSHRPNSVYLSIQRLIHGELENIRHRSDLTLDPSSMHHEKWLDEV